MELFHGVPSSVVRHFWRELVDTGRIRWLLDRTPRFGHLTDAERDGFDSIARDVAGHEVAAWIVLTAVTAQLAELTGRPPPGHRWILVRDEPLKKALAFSPSMPTVIAFVENILNTVACGAQPPPVPNIGGDNLCRALILLAKTVHQAGQGNPTVLPRETPYLLLPPRRR